MSKGKPMEWSDFTNKILGIFGKFVFIPLVIIGGLLAVTGEGIGVLILFGACVLFLLAALCLVILKPLLIKKYPEKRKDKYMVDPDMPHEELSPLQKIAVDHCGGDLVSACTYMLENLDVETQRAYTENLTQEEAAACLRAFDRRIAGAYTKKEIGQIVEEEYKKWST